METDFIKNNLNAGVTGLLCCKKERHGHLTQKNQPAN